MGGGREGAKYVKGIKGRSEDAEECRYEINYSSLIFSGRVH
jgi:hypothetical protein